MKSGSSVMRGTPRGSTHRTSFIDYVPEVYNSRASHQANPTDGLSVRSQHASSSSVASAGSSLNRDLSIRSENVTSNRVLSGRPRTREATKSARLATGENEIRPFSNFTIHSFFFKFKSLSPCVSLTIHDF